MRRSLGHLGRAGLIAAIALITPFLLDPPIAQSQQVTRSYTPIYEIQGSSLRSPLADGRVDTVGVVTGMTRNGFYLQDPAGDGDARTSDGLYVFTYSPPARTFPALRIGACVAVQNALVQEYYGKTELSRVGDVALSELCAHNSVSPAPLPRPRMGVDTVDVYERLEGMLVTVADLDGFVHGPTKRYLSGEAEIALLPSKLQPAVEGGRILRTTDDIDVPTAMPWPGDSLMFLSSLISDDLPNAHHGDRVRSQPTAPVPAILDYNFGKYQLLLLPGVPLTVQPGDPMQETGLATTPDDFTVCTYNVHGLGRGAAQSPDQRDYEQSVARAADVIAGPLQGCTIIGLQETGVPADATALAARLDQEHDLPYIAVAVDGPMTADVEFPLTNSFLVRADRAAVRHAHGAPACSPHDYGVHQTEEDECPAGQYPLFNRPPLVIDAIVTGDWGVPFSLRLVNNHWKSKAGDEAENAKRRLLQAQHVAGIVSESYAAGIDHIIVLGDLNDFVDTAPLHHLTRTALGEPLPLVNAWDWLPERRRYSFIFNGASQVLDHILISPSMVQFVSGVDALHINVDFAMCDSADADVACQASDHDPLALRLRPGGAASLGGDLDFAGIDVELVHGGGEERTTATTGPDGEFRLWNISTGDAEMRLLLPDWLQFDDGTTFATRNVDVEPGYTALATHVTPQVHLVPAMQAAAAASRLIDATIARP